jgi:hypothetical protein
MALLFGFNLFDLITYFAYTAAAALLLATEPRQHIGKGRGVLRSCRTVIGLSENRFRANVKGRHHRLELQNRRPTIVDMNFKDFTSFGETVANLEKFCERLREIERRLAPHPDIDTRIVSIRNCDAFASSATVIQRLLSDINENRLSDADFARLFPVPPEFFLLELHSLNNFSRLGFLPLYQFQIETMLRDLLVAAGQPKPSEFYSIAKEILIFSGIPDPDRKREILKLAALLRNTLHTNGIYSPGKHNAPVTIDIGGVVYNFVDQQPIKCSGWAYLLHALRAGLDVIEEILFSPPVASLPSPVKSQYAAHVLPTP